MASFFDGFVRGIISSFGISPRNPKIPLEARGRGVAQKNSKKSLSAYSARIRGKKVTSLDPARCDRNLRTAQ